MAAFLPNSLDADEVVVQLYRSLLSRWPVSHEERCVWTRHGLAFVIECGDRAAPPLILLHAAGTNSGMWICDVATYSRHHHVLAIDLPGEPGRSAPQRLPWQGDAWAWWLADVLDGLQIGKAMFLGLSQGAWTAMRFAALQPERVERMVLVSPAGIVPDRLSFALKALPLYSMGAQGRLLVQRMVLGDEGQSADISHSLRTLRDRFELRLRGLPLFSGSALDQLTMPVQIVMGGRDCVRDATRVVARAARHMPRLSAVVVPQSGHTVLHTRKFADAFFRLAPRSCT
jgi:pimeloyl-ACP methyl ester carboxylesterase